MLFVQCTHTSYFNHFNRTRLLIEWNFLQTDIAYSVRFEKISNGPGLESKSRQLAIAASSADVAAASATAVIVSQPQIVARGKSSI